MKVLIRYNHLMRDSEWKRFEFTHIGPVYQNQDSVMLDCQSYRSLLNEFDKHCTGMRNFWGVLNHKSEILWYLPENYKKYFDSAKDKKEEEVF